MAIIQVDMTELSDVVDVLQNRGIQYTISYEPGVAFLYGSENVIQQVRDILWASQVLDDLGMVFDVGQFGVSGETE